MPRKVCGGVRPNSRDRSERLVWNPLYQFLEAPPSAEEWGLRRLPARWPRVLWTGESSRGIPPTRRPCRRGMACACWISPQSRMVRNGCWVVDDVGVAGVGFVVGFGCLA